MNRNKSATTIIRHRAAPRGATTVEFAIVAPVTLLLIIGIIVMGLGIFRYQTVAMMAREASRYASVHGSDYATQTGQPAATAADIYTNAILPYATGLDTSKITYSVTWNTSNSPTHSATVNGKNLRVANSVTVTVNYNWIPEAYLSGIVLSSTSTAVMSF
jgi:Flp pilus assembly protein TadG